jgi:hypothetical protein
MATIGTITNIGAYTFLTGGPNEFDYGKIIVNETSTNISWVFFIWEASVNDLPVHRVQQSQRMALLREAAFRGLTVHIYAESDSSIVDGFTVDIT